MAYSRIKLEDTNYVVMNNSRFFVNPNPDVQNLQHIYLQYCRHKKFKSVMPIFDSEFTDANNDVIEYYDNDTIVAFSLIRKYDSDNIEAIQFAWNYSNPKLKLGIESLKHECALYKQKGYKYLYLGAADEYKTKMNGFETLGPI